MTDMTITVAVLAVLATASVTQLATRDEITARPRRALRQAIRGRRHTIESGMSQATCSCDWVAVLRPGKIVITDPDEPIIESYPVDPDEYGEADVPDTYANLLRELAEDHVKVANAAHPGYLYTLVTCPWCVSFYVGLLVVGTALAWGNGWGWQLIAGALAARWFAGAGVVHLGPEDDSTGDA